MPEAAGEGAALPIEERLFGDMVTALQPHICLITGNVDLASADVAVREVYNQFSGKVSEDTLGDSFVNALAALQETRNRPGEFYMIEYRDDEPIAEESVPEEEQAAGIGPEFVPAKVSGYAEVRVATAALKAVGYAGGAVAVGAITKYVKHRIAGERRYDAA